MNFKSENEFKDNLSLKNTYSIEEVKKKLNIELFWNEIIYNKYNKLVKIDKILQDKINKMKNESQEEYLLSEIVFIKKRQKNRRSIKSNFIKYK